MAEYKFVFLPAKSGRTKGTEVAELATLELNRDYVPQGWEPVSTVPGSAIGTIGFLLRRN